MAKLRHRGRDRDAEVKARTCAAGDAAGTDEEVRVGRRELLHA